MIKFLLPNINFERWKFNKEYQIYVSNLGHFKDKLKRPIPIKINKTGYCLIKTYYGFQLAHRLVMKTWNPTGDSENLTIDHLDHNKRNNALSNLEWVTQTENLRRAKEDFIEEVKPLNLNLNNYVVCNELQYKFHSIDDVIVFFDNFMKITLSKSHLQSSIAKGKKYCGFTWFIGDPDRYILIENSNLTTNPFENHKIRSKKLGVFDNFDDFYNKLSKMHPSTTINKTILITKIVKQQTYFNDQIKII